LNKIILNFEKISMNQLLLKKTLLFFLFSSLIYSCKYEEIKEYDNEPLIIVDTLDIEQIKIKTH